MSLADRIRSHAAISGRPGQYEELEAIADEVEAMQEQLRLSEQRSFAYATALIQVTHGQRHHACKPDDYVSCHAARFLAERAQ